jgi:ABC-type antimicrobial peptide transport system permease subunit
MNGTTVSNIIIVYAIALVFIGGLFGVTIGTIVGIPLVLIFWWYIGKGGIDGIDESKKNNEQHSPPRMKSRAIPKYDTLAEAVQAYHNGQITVQELDIYSLHNRGDL